MTATNFVPTRAARWPYFVLLAVAAAAALLFVIAVPAERLPRGDIVPASTTPPIVRSVP